ncbi:hypothetical protein [Noviherbaspirillum galbum]|uniref:Lipoprotein n=1 Tax=Noviherbaspirillum galbum TaxID=2709383 RepID=A0A6B3SYB1_9BURK|nr:hypothetical protein [Noviherbaspirillum galbum]NEX62899.1 hypothetical protein [Noviherbaspirillum galbum]
MKVVYIAASVLAIGLAAGSLQGCSPGYPYKISQQDAGPGMARHVDQQQGWHSARAAGMQDHPHMHGMQERHGQAMMDHDGPCGEDD